MDELILNRQFMFENSEPTELHKFLAKKLTKHKDSKEDLARATPKNEGSFIPAAGEPLIDKSEAAEESDNRRVRRTDWLKSQECKDLMQIEDEACHARKLERVAEQLRRYGLEQETVGGGADSFFESVAQQCRLQAFQFDEGIDPSGDDIRMRVHQELWDNEDYYRHFLRKGYKEALKEITKEKTWNKSWEQMIIHALRELKVWVVLFRNFKPPIRCDPEKYILFGEDHAVICRLDDGTYCATKRLDKQFHQLVCTPSKAEEKYDRERPIPDIDELIKHEVSKELASCELKKIDEIQVDYYGRIEQPAKRVAPDPIDEVVCALPQWLCGKRK
ncbi:uncharacterized protein [Watersipora subatra]|uniref:uncharacterized protein n=1 Tax=Watersipora subatra TaxID=2589382 RepID=UPI00355AD35F